MNEEELKKSIEELHQEIYDKGFQSGKAQSKCSKCKDTLENTQLICWTCHCQEKEKVEAQTIKDVKEKIEDWVEECIGDDEVNGAEAIISYSEVKQLLSSIEEQEVESGIKDCGYDDKKLMKELGGEKEK